jgi:hypothetical protein
MPSYFFDPYDYIGYIVPGSVMLLALVYLFPWVRERFEIGNGKLAVGEIGMFIIISYALGQMLHQLGHVIDMEPGYTISRYYPTDTVACKCQTLECKTLLSSIERERLLAAIVIEFKVKDDVCFLPAFLDLKVVRQCQQVQAKDCQDLLEENRKTWREVVARININLHRTKASERIELFNRSVGLHYGMATAFAIIFCLVFAIMLFYAVRLLLLLVKAESIPGMRLTLGIGITERANAIRMALMALVVGAACILSYLRMEYFSGFYARELFLTYLSQGSFTPL